MTYAIEVQGLSKSFHAGAKALDGVGLQRLTARSC